MKARRAAAETTARQQGRDEAARKRAHQFFEHMITNLVESRIFDEDDEIDVDTDEEDVGGKKEKDDGKHVLDEFDRYCEETPELNQLVRQFTVVARDEPTKQLSLVKQSLRDGFEAIDDATDRLKQAGWKTKGLSGFM